MNFQTIHNRLLRLCSLLAVIAILPQLASAQTTVKYVHTDALGSVVAMTDATGVVIEGRREYEAYGQQLTPAVQDGPGFTGHVQDLATGLTYMQQRYYDPMLGIFLSADPVTAHVSPVVQFHRYRYANGNPYRFIDLDGRRACGKDWDCAMSQHKGGMGFSSQQISRVARNPEAAIAKFNSIPNSQRSEAQSARYFAGTAGLVTRATGREVGADIARLGGSRHTVVNYVLGTESGVEQPASYSGPGTRVAIAHTHPGYASFSGRPAVYSNGWRGGFFEGDTERALAATQQNSIPVNSYVIGIGGGIHKFDMRSMWGDVNANRDGYFDADNYISELK